MTKREKVKLALLALLALGMASFLLPRLWIGLPSNARLLATFHTRANAEKMRGELAEALANGVAERSEFRERDNPDEYGELARLSPYLDMARSYNPDEFHTIKVLASMYMRKSPLPRSYAYGNFYFYQMALPMALGRAAGALTVRPPVEYLFEPDTLAPFYVCGRLWVWCYFAATLFLLMLIGWRGGKVGTFLATGWFAFLPVASMAACTLKPEIPVTFWSALALYFALRTSLDDRWKFWLLTGAAIGCAAATKYTGIAAAAAPLVIFCHHPLLRWKKLFACGATAAAVFAILTPALWLDFPLWWHDLAGLEAGVTGSAPWHLKVASGFVQYLCQRYYLFALAVLVLFFATPARKNVYARSAVGVFAVNFLLTCLGQPNSDSYLLPGYAALASVVGFEVASSGKIGAVVMDVLFGCFVLFNQHSRPPGGDHDVRMEATRWANIHLPRNSSVGMRRYPVSYRSLILDPAKYDLRNELENGQAAVFEADYYIDCSFEWDQTLFFRPAEDRVPPEYKPIASFGTPTRRRRNYFWETAEPFFVIYKRISP